MPVDTTFHGIVKLYIAVISKKRLVRSVPYFNRESMSYDFCDSWRKFGLLPILHSAPSATATAEGSVHFSRGYGNTFFRDEDFAFAEQFPDWRSYVKVGLALLFRLIIRFQSKMVS